ncbi:hypothetical protein BDQ94DRAFT_150172 [Aspergillus welwitschiae]|uniref:Uncharacterized protein n=1 Tax=Aspergillus welwitschiae TaxID=1341132 RepID=A0A3F3PRZ4_9EURO|nr:hypothetical protein BDQ94DRAFT_150172 [Aspergillus welwitschiae]RDH29654.1 hypothetical protein BDQ94DRAFT_150172 [Aspergillus welwitschiae]
MVIVFGSLGVGSFRCRYLGLGFVSGFFLVLATFVVSGFEGYLVLLRSLVYYWLGYLVVR